MNQRKFEYIFCTIKCHKQYKISINIYHKHKQYLQKNIWMEIKSLLNK
jgi:hypothetical protein